MIVIATPVGQIGRQVLSAVLASGDEPVRVIVRDPARLDPRVRERVEVVRGSLTDPDVVAAAFAGAGRVFWLLPPDPGAESVQAHLRAFAQPLRAALTSQPIGGLVYVSGLNPGSALDTLVAGVGVSYRALACPAFMDNLLQQLTPIRERGVFRYPVSGDRKLPACATRDIAAIAAGLLLDPAWTGPGRVPILGPEDLSYNDMARVMSEILRRPVRYQQVSGEAFMATLTSHGMSQAWARGLAERMARVDQGLYNAEPRTPESATPTSFRAWCQDVLKPAL